MDAVKPLLRAGYRHIREPSLLLELLRVARRLKRRENSVLKAGQEHDRELKSLCRMYRHQHHRVRRLVVAVNIADKRDVLEETGEGRLVVLLLVVHGVIDELADVRYPLEPVKPRILQHLAVAGQLEDLLYQLRDRYRVDLRLQRPYHPDKIGQSRGALRERRVRGGVLHYLERASVLVLREREDGVDCRLADLTLWLIYDPAEPYRVVRVL